MNSKYLYLTLDLGALLFPLLFSFYSKANFSRKWKYLWPAIGIPGVVFIVWDEIFTRMGIWGFNPAYLSGLYIGSLPLEEILFFICIPYACVFTYEALNHLVLEDHFGPYQRVIVITIIASSLSLGLLHTDKSYTCTTFLGLSIFLTLLLYLKRESFLGRFYFAYLIILIPFIIVNGILTGSVINEPVVWYNDAENLGIRLATIPIEDVFYGMLLIGMNISIFEIGQKEALKSDAALFK